MRCLLLLTIAIAAACGPTPAEPGESEYCPMSTTLGQTARYRPVVTPDPAEPASATTGAGGVRTPIQALADRTAFGCDAVVASPLVRRARWSTKRETSPTAHYELLLEPLGSVALRDAGVWYLVEHSARTVVDTSALALSASTQYYVYLYKSGAAVAAAVSEDPPTGDLLFTTGTQGADYVFAGWLSTDTASKAIPFNQSPGRYDWQRVVGPDLVLEISAEMTSRTTVPAPVVPSQATSFEVFMMCNSVGNELLVWSSDGDVVVTPRFKSLIGHDYFEAYATIPVVAGTPALDYRWSSSGPSASFYASGFHF